MSDPPKTNIQVGIRVRPLLAKERANGETEQWLVTPTSITQKDSRLLITNSCYSFNYVFNDETETYTIYERLVKPMLASSLEGYNATIFAYGQTSSGKTFTIRGEEGKQGLISLAINDICEAINESPSEEEFTVRASYMEIYNEVITDLLEPSKGDLDIHESLSRGVFVDDLTERSCHNSKQLFDVFNDGEANRKYGSTIYNEHSSRSHTVFRILLSRKKEDHVCKMSILNFVDLAGSERAGQGGAQGIRLKEAGFINKSLLTLGKVISELSRKQSHISFRESKLTRLLSSSLGGNSQTCILCTVSPNVVEETHLTLQFADRAMTITNRPKVNEVVLVDDKEMRIQYLTQEIEDLKQQVKLFQNASSASSSSIESVDNNGADVPTILGSMRFFKKRAGEYFDELQKEKKVQAELRWELEKVHTRNADLQALERSNRNKIQELEDDFVSLQRKHAVEQSFTLREHERDMAELITYDDMESVTKQMEEESEQQIESCKAQFMQMMKIKDSELERLQALCDTKSAELEILEENYRNQLAMKKAQIQQYQGEELNLQKIMERCDTLTNELETKSALCQQLQQECSLKSMQMEEQQLNVERVTEKCDALSKELEIQTTLCQEITDKYDQLSNELEHKNILCQQYQGEELNLQKIMERCDTLTNELETKSALCQQLQQECSLKSMQMEEQQLNVERVTEKCDELSKELEIQTTLCQQLQEECSAKSAELEEQQLNLERVTEKCDAVSKELEIQTEMCQQYQGEYNDRSVELKDHLLSLQKVTDRCNELSNELDNKNAIVQRLQEEYSAKSAELEEQQLNVEQLQEDWEYKATELEEQKQTIMQLQEECSLKSLQLEERQINVERVTEKCDELSKELEIQTTLCQEITDRCSQLSNELEQKNILCQQLQEECSAKSAELEEQQLNVERVTEKCDALSKELEIQTAMCQQYQGEYSDRSVELKDHKLNLQKITDRCNELSNELDNKNAVFQQLQEEYSAKSVELEERQLNVKTITNRCNQLTAQLDARNATCQKLEEELERYSTELKEKKELLEDCQSACVEAENEFYEASDKIEILNQKLEEDKEVIASLQKSNQELSQKLKEQLEENSSVQIKQEDDQKEEYLKSRIIYLDTIIERLKKENSSFKRDARDWEMEAKKLRKQNGNLEFKVECLETSCKSKGQPHSYTHERLKEQVGVVEAGMYWDIQRENSRLQAEKENAMAEFERIKQEVLRVRKERDVVLRKYKTLKERNGPV